MRYQELMESTNMPPRVADALSTVLRRLKAAVPINQYGVSYRGPEKSESYGEEGWYCVEARDWGNWENPRDAEDEEDYDWQQLSTESAKKLQGIVDSIKEQFPELKFSYSTEEKNWIVISAREIPQKELDAEAKRVAALPKRNLHDMLSKKLNGKKTGGIRWVVGPPEKYGDSQYFVLSWELPYNTMNTMKEILTKYDAAITKVEGILSGVSTKYADYVMPYGPYRPFDRKHLHGLDQWRRPSDPKQDLKLDNKINLWVYKPKKKK